MISLILFTMLNTHAADLKKLELKDRVVAHEYDRKGGLLQTYVVAKAKDGKSLWKTVIYRRPYVKIVVTELQDIELKELKGDDKKIVATDALNQSYTIDAQTGKLLDPRAPIFYSPMRKID